MQTIYESREVEFLRVVAVYMASLDFPKKRLAANLHRISCGKRLLSFGDVTLLNFF